MREKDKMETKEQRLREYVDNDAVYVSYKLGTLKDPSDFDNFCIEHCKDIEGMLYENQRLLRIARKMHLWIFLNSGDEEAVYNELGLTDEDNEMLGYGGKIVLGDINDNS